METVVVARHRNHHQCYGRKHGYRIHRFGSFGETMDSGNFREMSCRTFQSVAGLISTPVKACSIVSPVAERTYSPSVETLSLSVPENSWSSWSEQKSSTIPIQINLNFKNKEEDFDLSDLWAGPTYSNSPPPSSLPIPKFKPKPKRSVSLDLPHSASEIDFHPIAKSAPSSPTWDRRSSFSELFASADSATKTLRRILNLDITDE